MSNEVKAFTGRRRQRTTRFRVKATDIISEAIITVGGIGTIFAVMMVFLFLLFTAKPLFEPADAAPAETFANPSAASAPAAASPGDGPIAPALAPALAPIHIALDEYGILGWAAYSNGRVDVFRLDTGAVLSSQDLPEAGRITAWSFAHGTDDVVLGYDDGTVRTGTVAFKVDFLTDPGEFMPPGDNPAAHEPGDIWEFQGGLVQLTPERQFRLKTVAIEFADPLEIMLPSETGDEVRLEAPVVLVDHLADDTKITVCTLHADNTLVMQSLTERRNMLTGKVTLRARVGRVPFEPHPQGLEPRFLKLSELAANAFLIWPDGLLQRYSVQNIDASQLAEAVDVLRTATGTVPALEAASGVVSAATEVPADAHITGLRFLLGRRTLLVGDSLGRIQAWFAARLDGVETRDGFAMVNAHTFRLPEGEAVSNIATSSRSRLAAVGGSEGTVRIFHVTSQKTLFDQQISATGSPVLAMAFPPREDAAIFWTAQQVSVWSFDAKYPEASLTSLFTPVWYEGYTEPDFVWQSTSGTDDYESKLSLVPLIFGTMKATLYSLMFGVPVALLAAVYTSEFLKPKMKARIKPSIELMASLPSVVLGFLAALVFAPVVELYVPEVLASLVTVPLTILLGAYIWQLLPSELTLRLGQLRLVAMAFAFPVGVYFGFQVGPLAEHLLFGGDVKTWLDQKEGHAAGGWMFAMLPLSALVVAFVLSRVVNPRFRIAAARWNRLQSATADLIKFLLAGLATLGVAGVAGWLIAMIGFDTRGVLVDTYAQRNALVVGFVMGFAIIPIIYTIAEDALSAVPEHLRSASLGAGATPWQTAVRIIIPTAMSGLFSACMIGLGRAVGETMIVLMAAGNTPLMEFNPFNGLRTLSANLAVELPEAVRGDGHYRILFLSALVLFAMTFVINTIAEIVRLRFRRRAYQL